MKTGVHAMAAIKILVLKTKYVALGWVYLFEHVTKK